MGPSYANCFIGFTEHQFFSQYNGPKPEIYGRYIDDCISATSSTRDELTQLITVINSFRLALKYTWEIPDTSLAFLDIKISIKVRNKSQWNYWVIKFFHFLVIRFNSQFFFKLKPPEVNIISDRQNGKTLNHISNV